MRTNPSQPTPQPRTDLSDPLSVVLSDRRRHHVLRALASGAGDESSFDELVVAVTTFERAGQADEGPHESSSEVAITLHHCHIPKLADAGIVRYDDGETVALTDRGRECARALDVDR